VSFREALVMTSGDDHEKEEETRPAAVGPLWKKPRSDRGQANLSRRHPVDSLPGRRFSRRVDRGVARCLEDQVDGARRNEVIARGRCADVGMEKSACRLRIWFGRWGGRCAQGGRGRCADVGIPARCGGRKKRAQIGRRSGSGVARQTRTHAVRCHEKH
jgi:hypothetical protein